MMMIKRMIMIFDDDDDNVNDDDNDAAAADGGMYAVYVNIYLGYMALWQPRKNLSPGWPMDKFPKDDHLVSFVTIGYLIF